jgi:hypothetical protein
MKKTTNKKFQNLKAGNIIRPTQKTVVNLSKYPLEKNIVKLLE